MSNKINETHSTKTLLAFSLALVILDLKPAYLSIEEFIQSIRVAQRHKTLSKRAIPTSSTVPPAFVQSKPPTSSNHPHLPKSKSTKSLLHQLDQIISLTSTLSESISLQEKDSIKSNLTYLLQELSNSIENSSSTSKNSNLDLGIDSTVISKDLNELELIRNGLTRFVGGLGVDDVLGDELEREILGILERIWEREERDGI